ncbi:unnamed protein product [Brachionus calyciflorus]|uniref:PEHE domain-containing protein n=1 Tax=Brachionus calyciflorus TaxID=104777 RepID=A0A813MAA4_9BILA|nr:unnamed protein product [Brachionus calyciflorus]
MTSFELMENKQKNAKIRDISSNHTLILDKFFNSSSSALATPPPESIDFYKGISISDLRLTNLDQIIEDERFEEDSSLIPIIQTPPQSAASSINLSESFSNKKNFFKLSRDFHRSRAELKLNLQNSLKRLKCLKQNYLLRNRHKFSTADLNYEREKQKDESENEFTEDESENLDSNCMLGYEKLWNSSLFKLKSERKRAYLKLKTIKRKQLTNQNTNNEFKSAKIINLKSELKNLTERQTLALNFFKNSVKSNCTCSLNLLENEECTFCNLNRNNNIPENNNPPNNKVDVIYFDHSYTKFPSSVTNNIKSDIKNNESNLKNLEFMDSIDQDLINKLVNERLNKLFSYSKKEDTDKFQPEKSLEIQKNLTPDLPDLTNEELMSIFDQEDLQNDNMFSLKQLKKSSYNQSQLKKFRINRKQYRLGSTKVCVDNQKQSKKRRSRSRCSSADCGIDLNSTHDLFNIDSIVFPNDTLSSSKINFVSNPTIITPSWRELHIEPLGNLEIIPEELDEKTLLKRHNIKELKEKINFKNKNVNEDLFESEKINKINFDCLKNSDSKYNLDSPNRFTPLDNEESREMAQFD